MKPLLLATSAFILLLSSACNMQETTKSDNTTPAVEQANVKINTQKTFLLENLPIKSLLKKGSFYRVEEIDLEAIMKQYNFEITNIQSGRIELVTIDIPNQPQISQKINQYITNNFSFPNTKLQDEIRSYAEYATLGASVIEMRVDEKDYPNTISIEITQGAFATMSEYTNTMKFNPTTGEFIKPLSFDDNKNLLKEVKNLFRNNKAYVYDENTVSKYNIDYETEYDEMVFCRTDNDNNLPHIDNEYEIVGNYVIFTYNICDHPKHSNKAALPKSLLQKFL